MSSDQTQRQFFESLGRPFAGDEIFDHVPDTVYFVKDRAGCYVAVNTTLVERCGRAAKQELLGRTAREVFPDPLGEGFTEQDIEMARGGGSIHGQLELHLYPGGRQGWCLTWKEPLLDARGKIAGISGISRDVQCGPEVQRDLDAVSDVLRHIRENIDSPLRVPELAQRAELSSYQLDQRVRALFGISVGQFITRCRVDYACHQLVHSDREISFIALDSGYADQSTFTRQFRQSVGLTPKAYRRSIERS